MKSSTYALATALVFLVPASAGAQSWWDKHSGQSASTPTTSESSPPSVQSVPASAPQQVQAQPLQTQPQPQQQSQPQTIVLIPGDISKPYDILGNVEAEVKGRDSEAEAELALQQEAINAYGGQADAIIFYKAEMRVSNILAGFALKGGFNWKATGVAVRFK